MTYCDQLRELIRVWKDSPPVSRWFAKTTLNRFLTRHFGDNVAFRADITHFDAFSLHFLHYDYLDRRVRILVTVFPESRRLIADQYQRLAENKFAKMFQDMP